MSVVVIGIDPSSKKLAAVITIDGKSPRVWTKLLPDPAPPEIKAYWAMRHMRSLGREYVAPGVRVVAFVEEPVVGRGGAYATIIQATVRGGILTGLMMAKVREIHHVNNQRWKKGSVGKGNANKTEIKKWVMQTWPVVWKLAKGDEDVCDAAGINVNGQRVIKLESRIKKAREAEPA